MNKNTIITAIAFIIVLPLIYIFLNGFEGEEKLSFRGRQVAVIDPENGSVIVPTASENKKAVPMRATLNAAFIEQVSGLKPPFADKLQLTVTSVSNKVSACADEDAVPAQASFDLASTCATEAFGNMTLERKTVLEVDPKEQFIIFGATGNNQVKLYHEGMIANYVSKDMTKGDRKREACIVRIMLDHLVGKPANVESSCVVAAQG